MNVCVCVCAHVCAVSYQLHVATPLSLSPLGPALHMNMNFIEIHGR